MSDHVLKSLPTSDSLHFKLLLLEIAASVVGSARRTSLFEISPPELPVVDLNLAIPKPPEATEPRLRDTKAITETGASASQSAPQNTSPLLSPEVELDSGILEPAQLRTESDLKEATLSLTTDSGQDEQPSAANAINESNQPPVVESTISTLIELASEADANESQGVESAMTNETNNLQRNQDREAVSPVAVATDKERQRYKSPLKTPLLPSYQHLSKSEAVENLLQSNQGKTFHIDEITRALHGDLGVKAIKAERSRMYDTLKKGTAKGLWSAVPNSNNYYTIDLKSLHSTIEQLELLLESPLNPTPARRSKYSESLLPRYRQMGLSEAVALVVQENAGEILTPERVTKELFSDVSETALKKAQTQVNKWLRSGAKQGRWQRVPGHLAQYILALK